MGFMKEESTGSYSNTKIIVASILSFLASAAILILFIVFVLISKPSFKDLNKFLFVVLCTNFTLFTAYGICGLIKDPSIYTYASKTWSCSLVLANAVITLSVIALLKSHDRALPNAALLTSMGASGVAFIINTVYCIYDLQEFKPVVKLEPEHSFREVRYMRIQERLKSGLEFKLGTDQTMAERSREESEVKVHSQHSLRKEINPPATSIISEYKKTDESGAIMWKNTHFILGIEGGISMKKRWPQITSEIKSWLKRLPKEGVVVSAFTFDSTFSIGPLYNTPAEILAAVSKRFEVRGGSGVSFTPVLNTLSEIMKSPEKIKKNAQNLSLIHICRCRRAI
eukprot:TRINITY_DN1865_c0_g1_i5.p1 TRINITY_DN1865_c0_g1~~TRINITY_DN1865_c0_g1_i5.p1  ORF type:complete len:340 (-),score=57.92 TRINITY_DN1865_c0_g1_i5:42-1061(-)